MSFRMKILKSDFMNKNDNGDYLNFDHEKILYGQCYGCDYDTTCHYFHVVNVEL